PKAKTGTWRSWMFPQCDPLPKCPHRSAESACRSPHQWRNTVFPATSAIVSDTFRRNGISYRHLRNTFPFAQDCNTAEACRIVTGENPVRKFFLLQRTGKE